METNIEQRACLRFCAANGISCMKSYKMLVKAYGTAVLSKTRTYEWYKSFKDGRDVIVDLPRPGRPSSTGRNIEKVKALVMENCHSNLRDMAQDLQMSHESVRTILTDVLGMKRIAARFVPQELSSSQMEHRRKVAEIMLDRANTDPTFIQKIITGDKIWFFEFDMHTNKKTVDLNLNADDEPKAKRPRLKRSRMKAMLTVYFDYHGIIHFEFLPQNQTADERYYLNVMKHLRNSVREKRPELWAQNTWIVHHDIASSTAATVVRKFIKENAINVIDQAIYSPDMSPCNVFLFPKLKLALRGKRIDSIETIKEILENELKVLPESAFKKCFDDLIIRWHKCVEANGDYFEGDKVN